MLTEKYSFTERKFVVDGRYFSVCQWGRDDAPLLIALHGWLDNSASFNALAPLLESYRVVAIDFAGHGLSDPRPEGVAYYVWDNVSDVLAIAELLNADRFGLLGHSMGAGVATLLAACYPQKVERLFLIEGIGPVITDAEAAPDQLYKALQKRQRIRNRDVNTYMCYEEAVNARSSGRWPVALQAACWLAERGVSYRLSVEGNKEYFWHHDPWLVLPSPVRLTEEQVQYFLRKVESPVKLVLGNAGVEQSASRFACLNECQVFRLEGGHHLHMEADTAQLIAECFAE